MWRFFFLWLALVASNFIYVQFRGLPSSVALERSWFQGSALLLAWWILV